MKLFKKVAMITFFVLTIVTTNLVSKGFNIDNEVVVEVCDDGDLPYIH